MTPIYKKGQIDTVSSRLNISKQSVKDILNFYQYYVLGKIDGGENVRFLNICYISKGKERPKYSETLAFVAGELAKDLGLSSYTVFRVLLDFSEQIVEDIRKDYYYRVWGIVKVSFEDVGSGVFKLRLKKADSLFCNGYRVHALNTFKRKVEGVML